MWRGLDGICPPVVMYGKEENGLIQWKWIGPFFMGEMGGEVRAVRPSGERGTVVWGWFPETGGMNGKRR